MLSSQFDISEQGITNNIKESWNTTLFADIEFDQILSSGFIFEGQEKLMELINTQLIFSSFGNKMPISLYEGYYTQEKGGMVITIYQVLLGVTLRLKEIDQIIMETNKTFQYLNQAPAYKSQSSEIKVPFNKNKETKKVNDISSIIKKFKR
jgi:predicted amino acid-binding ACT domain protein